MSRRYAQLIPLTHDHHHALAHARQLRMAAAGTDQRALSDAAAAFLAAYDAELVPHFREEEEQLLPLLPRDDPEAQELTVRTLTEHVELHRLGQSLRHQVRDGHADPATATALATLLRAHVRMEEDRLFPLIERSVPEADLAGLHLAPRSRMSPDEAGT